MTSISTLWETLDTTVQGWLLQNPGTMVLPRTYVNMVAAGTEQVLHLDEHGEYWLTPDDMLFMKARRNSSASSAASRIPRPTGGVTVIAQTGPKLSPHSAALDQ